MAVSCAYGNGRASALKKPIRGLFATRFAAGESVAGSDNQSLARLIPRTALSRSAWQGIFNACEPGYPLSRLATNLDEIAGLKASLAAPGSAALP